MIRKFTVDVATVTATGEAYSPFVSGFIESIQYIKDGSNAYATGVDFTITAEATGENIWTQSDVDASVIVHPRAPTHTTAGVASLYASGGTAVNDRIGLSRDRIKIAIAQGGNAKTGRFVITMEDGR